MTKGIWLLRKTPLIHEGGVQHWSFELHRRLLKPVILKELEWMLKPEDFVQITNNFNELWLDAQKNINLFSTIKDTY